MKVFSGHQSSFIPWLGYWDKVNRADVFDIAIYCQFTKKTWQHYTYIGTAECQKKWGLKLVQNYPIKTPLIDVKVEPHFSNSLIEQFREVHKNDKYIESALPFVNDLLITVDRLTYLWEINFLLFRRIYDWLGLTSQVVVAPDPKRDNATEDIIRLTEIYDCECYYSGPHGRDYLQIERFKEENLKLIFQNSSYIYQNHPTSIVSLLAIYGNKFVIDLLEKQRQGLL